MIAVAASARFSPGTSVTTVPASLMALCAIGFALSMGRTVIMYRVGSRSREGIRTTARLLVCIAATFWITAPLAIQLLGVRPTLVMLALSLMAVGGMLVIHDASVSVTAKRIRLAFVFGAVGLMIVLASGRANPWHQPAKPGLPMLVRSPRAASTLR